MLDQYGDGARAVEEAVASLSEADLDRHADGEWSARQVIHHIADAELVAGVRLRRILSEDNPELLWVDEEEQSRRLHYERSVETSLRAFQGVVIANTALLDRLDESEWFRTGIHSRDGKLTVEDWLRNMSEHAHEHVAQLLRAAGKA